jgi:DNA-binding NtrC family response regulator
MNELQTKNEIAEVEKDAEIRAEQSTGPVVVPGGTPAGARVTLRTLRAETEMHAISEALEQTGWNRKRAAQLLSISYRGLLYKIRQHNITRDRNVAAAPKRANMADTLDGWQSPGLAVVGGGTGRTPGKE